jgi:hypothetical protein
MVPEHTLENPHRVPVREQVVKRIGSIDLPATIQNSDWSFFGMERSTSAMQ